MSYEIWEGEPCPKCGRKGLHYADHPHALGFKDYDTVRCRFCRARFSRIKLVELFTRAEREENSNCPRCGAPITDETVQVEYVQLSDNERPIPKLPDDACRMCGSRAEREEEAK